MASPVLVRRSPPPNSPRVQSPQTTNNTAHATRKSPTAAGCRQSYDAADRHWGLLIDFVI